MSSASFSNSPWIRGAPQSGLAAAIFRVKARISGMASGRPRRFFLEIHVQKSRKPLPCQDTTVSGLTIVKARRQSFQVLERHSKNNRSVLLAEGLSSPEQCPEHCRQNEGANQCKHGVQREGQRVEKSTTAQSGLAITAWACPPSLRWIEGSLPTLLCCLTMIIVEHSAQPLTALDRSAATASTASFMIKRFLRPWWFRS
jgi:hypothetical protein